MRNITSTGFIPNNLRLAVVKIISYEDKNFVGYLENPFIGNTVKFSNLTQLLLGLEELADELNCPKRTYESRRWFPAGNEKTLLSSLPSTASSEKAIATFKICIIFRQNASWQGSCEWIEEKKSANFRSALELVQLMDSVLENI